MTPVFYPRGYFPPKSNAERQREFRERNPGYYGRLHAKRRAGVKALRAQLAAELAAVEQSAPLALPAPVETIAIPNAAPVRLALPAPVEQIELVFPALEARRAEQAKLVPAKRADAA